MLSAAEKAQGEKLIMLHLCLPIPSLSKTFPVRGKLMKRNCCIYGCPRRGFIPSKETPSALLCMRNYILFKAGTGIWLSHFHPAEVTLSPLFFLWGQLIFN